MVDQLIGELKCVEKRKSS